MYNLLIVDDERNIRLGIQTMINRAYPGVFYIQLACDGVEALQVVQNEKIDIMITDIKMPRMDGIQLIREIQQVNHKPLLVILSGFDDFEYAREAIKNRVMDYLLKPINRNELSQAIDKVINELQVEKMDEDTQYRDYRASQLNYIIMHPSITEDEIEVLCTKMHFEESPQGYYVGVLSQSDKLSSEEYLDKISNLIDRHSECNLASHPFCFLDQNQNVVIITTTIETFHQITVDLDTNKYSRYCIGISDKTLKLGKIKESYSQARYALKHHFLLPRINVIEYQNLFHSDMDSIPVEAINKISNMIGTDRDTEIKELLHHILEYETLIRNPIKYLEAINEQMNTIVFENYKQKLGQEPEEFNKLYKKVQNIYHFDNYKDYFQSVESLLLLLHEYVKQIKSVYSEQKYMEKALEFIKENYYKDLNLAVVSNYISLNYSYFSHIFKEYTGSSFVNYLKRVRINKAKQLLNDTDYKVFEIGEMVGYKNSKQFARIFKEMEGVSPSEYRGFE